MSMIWIYRTKQIEWCNKMKNNEDTAPLDFIRQRILEDVNNGKNDSRVHTRFPPEPNGYLHIGHAKSICLNFGVAGEYDGGKCNLRFDDTNPEKEEVEYVESIKEDVKWLGYDWEDRLYFASDYFEKLYDYAVQLIKSGKAFVCSLSADEMREYRGTLTQPGKNSPYRDRSVEENFQLFTGMKDGKFEPGEHVLRAKIDMASPNVVLRDPVIYRVLNKEHHRTGGKWCIYPMYDYTHCLSDSIEGITHSLCTLEFENNRAIYDWVLDELNTECHPQQIEFARLNLSYTILSKRKLLKMVNENLVLGWDDPRMPTISGLRRRGYSPESIRKFCDMIGVAKANSLVDVAMLEYSIREHLNKTVRRVMAVLDPLKVVIENYPEDKVEDIEADNNPEDPDAGKRMIPFSREIYIEREDFMEDPPKKFFRFAPGREIRLKHAYYITCTEVIKDESGNVTELRCTYDPESRGGGTPDKRKVKGTLHWVSIEHAVKAEVRLYDRLFLRENPEDAEEGKDFTDYLNPDSLEVLESCYIEPGLEKSEPLERFQFMRKGYFCVDAESTPEKPVFNRTVTLRDAWARMQKAGKANK